MPKAFKAVIFDLDGLVIDSETGYLMAWQQALDVMGFSLDSQAGWHLSGANAGQVQAYLLNCYGADFDLNQFRQLSSSIWLNLVSEQGIPVKTGFFSLLNLLTQTGLDYCLATNSSAYAAQRSLDLAGLQGVFKHIVRRDDVLNPKPAPDIFLTATQRLNQRADECLVLEDSLIGIRAAAAAGLACYYIPSQSPADAEAISLADQQFVDLQQVCEFFQAITDKFQQAVQL